MATRILVLRPGAIGDTLLTVPALQALRHQCPSARIEMAGNAVVLPLLKSSGLIDHDMAFDDPRVTRLFMAAPPLPDDPFLGLDLVVGWCSDPDGLLTRAFEVRGASRVIVAPSRPPPGAPVHVASYLLAALRPLGIEQSVGPRIRLPLSAATAGARQAWAELRPLGLECQPFVAIHPGSGSPAKNWPAERFGTVISELRERTGLETLILGGPADADALNRLRASVSSTPALLLDRPLPVVASIVERARAYLGNDSGLSHLAGLLGVPTLALFGPTDPQLWSPLGPLVRVLRSEPLAALQPDRVLAELCAMLDPTAATR